VLPAARELEVGVGARQFEEDTVIAVVVLEAADLLQSESVSVEADDGRESVRVSCESDLYSGLLLVDVRTAKMSRLASRANLHHLP
jgi:hypothetical protein